MALTLLSFVSSTGVAALHRVGARIAERYPRARLDVRTVEHEEFKFLFELGATPELLSSAGAPPWSALVVARFPHGALEGEGQRSAAAILHRAVEADATVAIDERTYYSVEHSSTDRAFTLALQRRKVDIDQATFFHYYTDVYVPAVLGELRDPPFHSYSTGLVLDAIGDFGFDGVTFNEYPSGDALRAHVTEQIAEVRSRATQSNFVHTVEKYSGHRLTTTDAALVVAHSHSTTRESTP